MKLCEYDKRNYDERLPNTRSLGISPLFGRNPFVGSRCTRMRGNRTGDMVGGRGVISSSVSNQRGGAIQSPQKRDPRFQNVRSHIRSSSMKRLQTGGSPWEDEGPNAEEVRRDVFKHLKTRMIDVEWEKEQQTIQDAILKLIPDTRDDFGSFRGYATFNVTEKLASEVLNEFMLPKRRFWTVEKYVGESFCKHFSYSQVLYLG